jgi:hypothetical protein
LVAADGSAIAPERRAAMTRRTRTLWSMRLLVSSPSMSTRRTRTLWSLLGLCLLIGAVGSTFAWLTPPDHKGRAAMRELAAIADVMALLFWMLIFAVYWATHPDDDAGKPK